MRSVQVNTNVSFMNFGRRDLEPQSLLGALIPRYEGMGQVVARPTEQQRGPHGEGKARMRQGTGRRERSEDMALAGLVAPSLRLSSDLVSEAPGLSLEVCCFAL